MKITGPYLWRSGENREVGTFGCPQKNRRRITKKRATVKQLLQLRDEFIGVTSHELKTPATSIKIYARRPVVKKGKYEKQRAGYKIKYADIPLDYFN